MFTHHVALPTPQAVYDREARLAPSAAAEPGAGRRPSDGSLTSVPAPSLDSLDALPPPATGAAPPGSPGGADEGGGFMALDHTWDLRLIPAGGETMRPDCEARDAPRAARAPLSSAPARARARSAPRESARARDARLRPFAAPPLATRDARRRDAGGRGGSS